MIPRLVILAGQPGSGKTTMLYYMKNTLSYVGHDLDEFAIPIFGQGYDKELARKLSAQDNRNFFRNFKNSYIKSLKEGKDTAVADAIANNQGRRLLLHVGVESEKYLIVLQVDESIRKARIEAKGKRYTPNWLLSGSWEEPDENLKEWCTLLIYPNNTEQDRRNIEGELVGRFARQ